MRDVGTFILGKAKDEREVEGETVLTS